MGSLREKRTFGRRLAVHEDALRWKVAGEIAKKRPVAARSASNQSGNSGPLDAARAISSTDTTEMAAAQWVQNRWENRAKSSRRNG